MKKVSHLLKQSISVFALSALTLSTAFILPVGKAEGASFSYTVKPAYTINAISASSPSLSRNFSYSPAQVSSSANKVYSHHITVDASTSKRNYSYDVTGNSSVSSPVTPVTPPASSVPETQSRKVVLAEGTKYATEMYIIDSGKPGPVVMIVGGVHGSERAGYTAAAEVKNFNIKKGKLLVVPQANKRAVENKSRYVKGEGDLNRSFPQSSTASPDTVLARAIYTAVKQYDVKWLMDMHEGYDYYKNTKNSSVGQTLIYYPSTSMKNMANKIVNNLNKDINDNYKKFALLRYPVKGSLARAAGQYMGVNSYIFETCDNPSLSTRVNYQLKAANTLLSELGMK